MTASRAVIVGNAAQTLHPIGAQGFNLGLRDALTLAEFARDAREHGGDVGGAALLDAYAQRRAEDREQTIGFSDGLARITSNPSPPVRLLRSLAMHALDALPDLRASLVGGAMGFRGVVPALARDVVNQAKSKFSVPGEPVQSMDGQMSRAHGDGRMPEVEQRIDAVAGRAGATEP